MIFDSNPTLNQSADASSDDRETELWLGQFSPKAMIGSWIMAVVVSAAIVLTILAISLLRTNTMVWTFGIGVIVLLWVTIASIAVYRKLAADYVLTTQRLKHRNGIFFRTQNRMELIDVDDVLYRQGPIQAMLGVGDIIIDSSDKSHPQLIVRGIDNVAMVVDLIDDARRKERQKRGFHINQ